MAHDYPCGSCGGVVEAVTRPGRTMLYRGVQCLIPDNLLIRTCRQCGAEWMDGAEISVLSEIVERQRQDALQNANEASRPPMGSDTQSPAVGAPDAVDRPLGVAERAVVPDPSSAEGADPGDDETAVLACPCLHTTPCHARCTCLNGGSSFGCRRCCTYGSPEQQKAMAKYLARVIDAARKSSV